MKSGTPEFEKMMKIGEAFFELKKPCPYCHNKSDKCYCIEEKYDYYP